MADSWADLRDGIASRLRALPDRGVVIVGEPVTYGEPAGLIRRRPRPLPNRYAQVLRMGDLLSGECVGATSFGGDWEMTGDQLEAVRGLGWLAPADLAAVHTEPGYPNFRVDVPLADADRLAGMCVEALAVLGLTPGETDLQEPPG